MASRQKTFDSFLRDDNFVPYAKQVAEWNFIANSKKIVNGIKVREFQWGLIEEEAEEIFAAVKESDKKQTLAEVCDLFVVSTYGLFLHLHENNRGCTLDEVISKMAETCSVPKGRGRTSLYSLDENIFSKQQYEVVKWAINALEQFGGNSTGALQAIIDANYTKFPFATDLIAAYDQHGLPYGDDICKQECARIEEEFKGRYKGVQCEHVLLNENDLVGRLIFRDDQGKILKPLTFKKADISPFVLK